MLVPTASDRTDGLDHRTGRPFPAELLIGELPDGWWAVDGHQVQAPDGEGPRLFDSVGPMPGIEAALAVWREARGTVGSLIVRIDDGTVVEHSRIA